MTVAIPRRVNSNQDGIHQNLNRVVAKHLNHAWRKPISSFSHEVFASIERWLAVTHGPLILDSGCGTGESSISFAQRYPASRVLGFDRSEVRLDKLFRQHLFPDNCLVVRADAEDLWRQLAEHSIKPERHYLMFPNPYPKAAQLNKRWHGSPVFPSLVAMGGQIEIRSNWRTYLDEFQQALLLAANIRSSIEQYSPTEPISAFEKKYHQSGQELWRLQTAPTDAPIA